MSAAPGPFVLVPQWHGAPASVSALSTLRSGGVSRGGYDDGAGGGGLNLGVHVGDDSEAVAQNRARLRALLPADPAWLTQVHGSAVLDAAQVRGAPEADASIAIGTGAVCVIQTADCLPVLFCDTTGRVVGAAHAGWRGLASGVLENTVSAMRAAGASEILAWLGPAIGPASFEVGEDVRQAFLDGASDAHAAFLPNINNSGKYFADIYALARLILHRQGVERISGGGFCTMTDAARFYSFRRDRITGRMASLVWLND
ncbi:peptidoglycan editing factor PgeF [Janthinobacterium sp. 17J80-10]|uniref:peptidoglycan editing factor PgeF n=1 Tax=Janthinobacterium sp. 17J80-10 TaxID=2497863 RepID=UPI001005A914|nr:peptidoglycan editing factor PgeF [Janthinobacterium sp. 17J80-10]QAU34290.1 peptidoglycan editing factor PgeF [Janthinobacterium sp. 17J80-10]